MTKIISLGGSIIVPEEIDIDFLKKFKSLIINHSKKEKIVLMCGGGKTCRKYDKAAKKLGTPKTYDLDMLGINATRLNAELVRIMFGKYAYKNISIDPNKKINFKNILVAGGDKPGASSDHDSVILAKTYSSKEVLNLTNIDYVYDLDPKKYKNAKPRESLSWNEFLKIIGHKWVSGKNYPFDPIASNLAKKNNITVNILNGKNIKNVKACLEGKKFTGTKIN